VDIPTAGQQDRTGPTQARTVQRLPRRARHAASNPLIEGSLHMKFAMGADTLAQLGKRTSSASGDLGTQVKALLKAAEPLENRFNGAGRAAFDRFKGESDEVAAELDRALAAVLGGIGGMDTSFGTGDQQMADDATSAMGSVSFDSARFSGR
jgi:hypothetical protein